MRMKKQLLVVFITLIGFTASYSQNSTVSLASVRIYPNPSTENTVTIENTNESLQVIIFDLLGKKVMETTITSRKNSIDISSIHRGIYMITFSNDNSSITKKFIKQ